MDWPFKTMRVGEKIAVTENIHAAQRYVHVYARGSGKRFSTKILQTPEGAQLLGVQRLPDSDAPAAPQDAIWGDPDQRTSWPFKTLRVGDSIQGRVFREEPARNAERTYSRLSGKEFRTQVWASPQGLMMRVTRIA